MYRRTVERVEAHTKYGCFAISLSEMHVLSVFFSVRIHHADCIHTSVCINVYVVAASYTASMLVCSFFETTVKVFRKVA